jgi:hypothetical protein
MLFNRALESISHGLKWNCGQPAAIKSEKFHASLHFPRALFALSAWFCHLSIRKACVTHYATEKTTIESKNHRDIRAKCFIN